MSINTLTTEQVMLQDTLARYFQDIKTSPVLPDEVAPETEAAIWQGLTELGVTTLLAPEEAEALDGGGDEAMLALMEMGRAGLTTPFLYHSVLGMLAMRRATPGAAAARWLDSMQRSDVMVVPAFDETGTRYNWCDPQAIAIPDGDGFRFEGRKTGVRYALLADALIVSARVPDASASVALFLVPQSECVGTRTYRSIDGAPLADIILPDKSNEAILLVQGDDASILIEQLRGWHIAGLCALSVGAMQHVCELTVRYMKERKQFGQELAKFQVLRHYFIDMRIQLLKAESMASLAVGWADQADGPARREALAAAKYIVSQAARFISQQAVQLHGAIGMTAEYELGTFVRLLTAAYMLGGDPDSHLARLS